MHRQFLELVLCYEIEPLTADERADCADAFCACGGIHDPDALKKQLARLKLELNMRPERGPSTAGDNAPFVVTCFFHSSFI